MKKVLLFLIAVIVSATTILAQQEKIVILEVVDKEMQVANDSKQMVRDYIGEAIAQSKTFEVTDYVNVSDITEIDGYEFYRTGQLNKDDIHKIGQFSSAQKVLIVEVSQPKSSQLYVISKLYDASTANLENTADALMKEKTTAIQAGIKDLVSNLLKRYNNDNKGFSTTKMVKSSNISKPKLVHNPVEIRKIRKEFSYGDVDMSEQELLEFLSYQCPEALNRYIKAKRTINAGWGVLGGTALFAVPVYVPCLVVGYKNLDKAIEYFNNNCATND